MCEQFRSDMRISKSRLMPGAFEFEWKKLVVGTLAIFHNEKEVNIQSIQSIYPGKGHCQEFIKLFKKDCEEHGFQLVSSHPISEIWEHIAKKFNLKIYKYNG